MDLSLKLSLVSLMMMMMMMMRMTKTSAAAKENFCSNSTVMRTRTSCHSCSISVLIPCPSGYKRTPGSVAQDCRYYVKTASLKLHISGCSFECYREVEVKSCCPGHWGPDCVECPDRPDKPCSERGNCSDGAGGDGTCSCQSGFAGTSCEDCEPGRFGSSCRSVCSCVHGLCDSGLKGDGRCTCFSGYKGPNCDQEVPECAALTCQPNSRCMEEALTGKLVCQCLPGHQKSGDQCLSINPCVQRVCHVQASCVHTGPNQHLCACNEGHSGDGRVCMAIDPCQTRQGGCAAQSTRCVYDGPGKSHCECLPGFDHLSDGGCSLKDSCRPGSCHKNANCSTVGPGRVECTCVQGYIGNGKVCYGNIMQHLNELNTEPGGQWSGQLSNAITLFGSLSWPLQNLGPFTLFVPINKGFRGTSVRTLTADLSKAKYLCKMHLVAGVMPFDTLKKTDVFYTLTGKSAEIDTSEGDTQTKIRIHGSRKRGVIIQSDVVASNGMIHLINKLMDSVSPTVESDPKENLMKIISDYGKFDTFKSLLEKTELASVMDLPGPITVFAPSTSAFDAMTDGHLTFLSSTEGHNKLVELLRNHVVQSTTLEVYNAVSSPTLVTMANQVLTINVTENGQILVNGAAVLEAAVEAKNGRLYVLDGVLTPPSIQPVLPHRCDITETKTVRGECVRCSKVKLSQCSSGVYTGASIFGCVYTLTFGSVPGNIVATGCSPLCNATVKTPACCKGFYGPDCGPCPGGHQTPCSGHGQCLEGVAENGSCVCDQNFRGSRCQYCSSSNKHGPNCDTTCLCVHGQCDNRPDSNGGCKVDSCLPGFTGRFCDRQTAVCGVQGQFCHAHADCDFSEGTIRCVCKPGYQGDGITCVEADPCAPPLRGGCSVNAKCIKTGAGTRSCQCLTGWREDGDECQPINNCDGPDRGGCHSNATCIYVGPGQSDCSCKSGYQGDGRDCEAVNQCVSVSGGCHHLASCRRLSSQWTCVCDDGYLGDGHLCFGTVEEELVVLLEASQFSRWTTDAGVSLSDQNFTLLVPSSAAVDKMSADDKHFWTTKGNLPSLISLSSTSSLTSLLKTTLPVSTSNELTTVGGATITTSDITATNGLIHIIDQVLVPDRKLSEGLLGTLALRPEFSLFRSYLIDYNLTDEIQKDDEFTVFAPTDSAVSTYLQKTSATALDVNTTRYHVVAAERLLKTDLQPGGYKQTLLGFSFQLGIFPRDGKLFVNDAQINSSNILSGNGVIHGLSAVLHINRNRCDEAIYKKVMETCVDCLFPRSKICPNETVPEKPGRSRKCMFTRMFEEERLLTIGCKASCLRKTIVQRCCAGFFGPHCEPCPGPQARPCSGNGPCSDGTNGTGVCRCNSGFNGTACETCQSGRYGVHCDQVCRCSHGRCSEGLTGDGTCECDVGWRGVVCDESRKQLRHIYNIYSILYTHSIYVYTVYISDDVWCVAEVESGVDDLCGSVKCHSSANCVIELSGPRCLCAAGFQGNGTSCQATDPCVDDNGGCSLDAVCKRTRPGRRECVCNNGFSGDGLVCVEINACLEGNGGCHANADCVHVGPNKTTCACADGYSGDGQNCHMINVCLKKNGGCHQSARCNMTAPGVRTCTCRSNFLGDGLTCKGTLAKEMLTRKLRDFYLALTVLEISLRGRGPFTVFVPSSAAFAADSRLRSMMTSKRKETCGAILRSHIVMCHTLLPADLSRPRNLTSLSGLVLTTSSSQSNIFINQVNVTYSDGISINGIFHEIDKVLLPPDVDTDPDVALNLTDVADRHGYRSFYKLLQDTGVVDLLSDGTTVFMPSDAVMASLPQQQRDFLFHPDHRPQLVEYLKYHVLQGQRIYAEGLIHLDSARTLQGSSLSFNCGGTDDIGEIFVNDGKCRIVQRHLVFTGGLAYGIDCLLTPPSLGGRCDEQSSFDLKMSCGICSTSAVRCPKGSKQKEIQKCDLPKMFVTKNSGCLSVCTVNFWQPKCCHGYHGRDCLVCPGGAGSPCGNRGKCDDGHLGNGTCTCDAGFGGMACEQCSDGFFGPTCKACNCSQHASCDDGRRGTGSCFCEAGWTGERCDVEQAQVLDCSPSCSPKAVCKENNTCVCRTLYEGDGFTCTVVDMCQWWNGGCAKGAQCSQRGEQVSCSCPKGHSGDGFTCQPVDPCVAVDNGGCHEHATCTMTAPGKKKCTCKAGFVGDGVTCEVKQLPISRCLQDNGRCHQDAKCTDLHFEDATLGVFHLRSDRGQYKLNYTRAQQACAAEGGGLATYTQLAYAQQGGLNMCAVGWLDEARAAYPTTYSNPNCGFGHVGIVDYGVRRNLSETWDAFCYRRKEVSCECQPGFVGDGFRCTGNLLQVLASTPTFSNFLTQIRNNSETSSSGKQFVQRLSNLTVQSTLFVPDNDGLPGNQTLSQRDIEFHLSEGRALPLSELRNGSRMRTRVGSLMVVGVSDLLDPSALSSRYINDRFVTDSDILASNGIIHVLQGALKAPPPRHEMQVGHKAGMGVGVTLLVILVAAGGCVGYNFYSNKTKGFNFHYFKDEEEEEEAPHTGCSRSICNPVYESAPESESCDVTAADKHEEDRGSCDLRDGGSRDLLRDGGSRDLRDGGSCDLRDGGSCDLLRDD
ncbi:stabilin-2 isoform X2 [Scophthalmus maximus]|uniref:stabilin-2 isoform X2 n=1 Tax=Scophthalmus maximus TaxID=52904 RepID=UPI001FA86621|nr:stabilin-2 isoform X2 [Scophthalmus maximus]